MLERTAPSPQLTSSSTGQMVRLILRHPDKWSIHVVAIEPDELNGWIAYAQRYGFAFEAESIDCPVH
jgi:hypothetical protein